MKRTMIGTLALAATFMISAAAFAAETKIMKGTPVIDGKMDAIYSKTISIPVADTLVYSTAPDPETDTRGIVYLMYDNDFFYVYGEVTDSYVAANPNSTEGDNPWSNDAVENWVDLGNGVFKASVAPFIPYVFGMQDPDPATCKFATTKGAKGYTIELAIPASLAEGQTISYVTQLNDYGQDEATRCYGAQSGGVVEYTLGGAVK